MWLRLVASAVMWALSCQGTAKAADAPIVIKFSHVVAPDTPKGKAALRLKEIVELRSDGQVRIEVYPNSTLYKDNEELEALQLGAVQMLAPSLAKFAPLGIKEFDIFDLPFLFEDKAALHRAQSGALGPLLFAALEARGIKGLAFWDNGFKVMSANRPLRTPADFRGLKMRIQGSKVLDAQFRSLGAKPQVMALSEVYQALRTGLVDGTENPPSNLYTQRIYEVQKNVTVSNHGYLGYAVIVNKRFWDNLPGGPRQILDKALREVTEYENTIAQKENDDALEAVRQSGKTEIYVLTATEREIWKSAMHSVYVEMEPRLGKDLVDAVKNSASN